MDAFEKAKNVKKEIESAEALQRGPTLTKKYVYSILFSLSFLVHLLNIERMYLKVKSTLKSFQFETEIL